MEVAKWLISKPLWLVTTRAGLITTGIALAILCADAKRVEGQRKRQLQITRQKALKTSVALKHAKTCADLQSAQRHLRDEVLLKPFNRHLGWWHSEWHTLSAARDIGDQIQALIDNHRIEVSWEGRCHITDIYRLKLGELPILKKASLTRDVSQALQQLSKDLHHLGQACSRAETNYCIEHTVYLWGRLVRKISSLFGS